MREIDDILNLLRSNADPETLTRCIEFLKEFIDKKDLVKEETMQITNTIKECLSLSASYMEDNKKISSEESGIYLELYCMLSITVLNFLNDDDIEYNNIVFTVVSKCTKLVRFFNCHGYYGKGDYYSKNCKELINKLIDKCNSGQNVFVTKILMDKKMSIDLYYIETISNIGKLEESFDEIQKVKERLPEFPNHLGYFVNICYNTSIKFYKKERYEYSITLLEIALNVTDTKQSGGDISAILRLLSHIYMKRNPATNWQKCLNLFSLMKEKDVPITFFSDLLTAAFFSGNQNIIVDILNHFCKSDDFSTYLVSEVVEKLNDKGYYKTAIDFIQKVKERSLELMEKLYLYSLELQMYFKTSSLEKASSLLEDAIKLAKSANVTLRQSNYFCKVLFSYADGLFKSNSFMQCLTWYKKFLKFVEATKLNDAATVYLKQRICLCYLKMNEGQLAKQMFMKIEWPNSNTDSSQLYLALQIAFMCEDDGLADTALKYTGKTISPISLNFSK
ncbi:hypothetical protein AVEN_210320-1 [Araneus ventricosus]|uniref:Protein ZIP4 homolog n=1 Tax=Araneus ventricosus TaxID=182803 RepID=A0A4Y2JWE1_ARAVE|nr:hypothetical protein AVEN_210320-1 [Araneus ventricosus]